jgi:hypothetical protein
VDPRFEEVFLLRLGQVRGVAEAQDSIGAIIRERATCTFDSLDGSDAPTRTYWVKIDGEHNKEWAARQPKSDTLLRRLLEDL